MVIIGAIISLASALAFAPGPSIASSETADSVPIVRRLAATAQLAAQEYRVGVDRGRVVAQAEVDEARLFLREARRSAALLPAEVGQPAAREIDAILRLVSATAAPDSVDARVKALVGEIADRLHIVLDEIPPAAPSLVRGGAVYRANCASCHGNRGAGDGPAAGGLDPPPADLTAALALRDQSPLDFYRRITIGTVGTAMPAFETSLSADDRWAAAAYATLLRLPPPAGDVPAALRDFPTTAKMSDSALLTVLELPAEQPGSPARLAAIRSVQADSSAAATAGIFDRVRSHVDSAVALASQGKGDAADASALDAYMTFEQVERSVRAKNPTLAAELETAFANLRTSVAGTTARTEIEGARRDLAAGLERAQQSLGDTLSPVSLFVQSLILLVREGLEAILIVGALLTFLTKIGAGERRRDIHLGVGAAIAMSLLTAVALETVIQISPTSREALEGTTMVLATAVLFYVSYWLLSKMEVVKWNHFVKSKVHDAVTSGSSLALASAAFLAVYREGFETVLFYNALFLASGAGATAMPVVGGILIGAVVLVGVYVAINRFGVRLPLKPFFAVTSGFLYYMAFVFAGKGVAELQEGGFIPTTFLSWAPRAPGLGIYPTAESLGLQLALVALLLVALGWTFAVEPRRSRRAAPAGPLGRGRVRVASGGS